MRQHRFHLNVTERCNARCVHCYWEEYGANADPSLEAIADILRQFKQLGNSYYETRRHMLTLGGGEPTLRADLEDIIRLAVRMGFRVRLVTNAIVLPIERAMSLRKAGLEAVQVSLDGATEQTHDRVRGKGNWRRSMAGIAALKNARLFTVLSYVLLPGINMDEAPALLELASRLKVGGVKFARPIRDGQARVRGLDVQADYMQAYQGILDHARAIRYKRMLLFFDPLAHSLSINARRTSAGLWGVATDLCQCNNTELVEVNGSTGDIYYCRVRVSLGNLREQSLSELWHHHPLLNAIRRKSPEGACGSCGVWQSCRGGCPAVVLGRTGQALLQDEDCYEVRRQFRPILFSNLGHSNPRMFSNGEKVRGAVRNATQQLFRLLLR